MLANVAFDVFYTEFIDKQQIAFHIWMQTDDGISFMLITASFQRCVFFNTSTCLHTVALDCFLKFSFFKDHSRCFFILYSKVLLPRPSDMKMPLYLSQISIHILSVSLQSSILWLTVVVNATAVATTAAAACPSLLSTAPDIASFDPWETTLLPRLRRPRVSQEMR